MTPMKPPSPTDKDFEDTLSLAQVCRRLRIPRARLNRMLAAEEFDFVEIRGRLRVPLDAVSRYEKGRGKSAPCDDR